MATEQEETPAPASERSSTMCEPGPTGGGDLGGWMQSLRLFPSASEGGDGRGDDSAGGYWQSACASPDGCGGPPSAADGGREGARSLSPSLVQTFSSNESSDRTPRGGPSTNGGEPAEAPADAGANNGPPRDEPPAAADGSDAALLPSSPRDYGPCPAPSDFDPAVWLDANLGPYCGAGSALSTAASSWRAGAATALGLAAAGLTFTPAVLVVHPLVLVGAAAGGSAALWAVGGLGDDEDEDGGESGGSGGGGGGYRLFSGEEFGRLFWADGGAAAACEAIGNGGGSAPLGDGDRRLNQSLDEGIIASSASSSPVSSQTWFEA